MAHDPNRLRRTASLAAIAIAVAASMATSQYRPYSSFADSDQATVRVDAANPSAEGTLAVTLSSEVLPAPAGQVSANGTFTIRAVVSGTKGPRPSARLTVVPLGGSPELTADEQGASGSLAALCQPGRPCQLEYEVRIEHVGPVPAEGAALGWEASVRVSYDGRDVVPPGADVTFAGKETLVAVAAPAGLDATVGEDELVLDIAHPVAVREVELTLSADALPTAIEAPATGVANFEATWLDRPKEAPWNVPFSTLVVPVESLDEPADARPRTVGRRFEPFATCVRDEPCSRRVLLVFEWSATDPATVARLSWSLDARVRLPGSAGLAPGASLDAAVVRQRQAGAPAAAVESVVEEVVSLTVGARAGSMRRIVRFTIDPVALPPEELAGLPPPAVVLVTARARTADGQPAPADALVHVSAEPPNRDYTTGQPVGAIVGGEPVQLAFLPLRGCEAGQPCEVEVSLNVRGPQRDGPLPTGTGLLVDLRIATTLHYLDLPQPPAGARIDVSVVDPPP